MTKGEGDLFIKKGDDLYRTDLLSLYGAGNFDVHTKTFNTRLIEELDSLIRQYPDEYKKLLRSNREPSEELYQDQNDTFISQKIISKTNISAKMSRLLMNWRMINKFILPKTNKQNLATHEELKPKNYKLLNFKVEALGSDKDEKIEVPLNWTTLLYLFVLVETDIDIDAFDIDSETLKFLEKNSNAKVYEIDNLDISDRKSSSAKYKHRKNTSVVVNNIKKTVALENEPSFEEVHGPLVKVKLPASYSDDLPDRNENVDYVPPSEETVDNIQINKEIDLCVGASVDLDENTDKFELIYSDIELLNLDKEDCIEKINNIEKSKQEIRTSIDMMKAAIKIEIDRYEIYVNNWIAKIKTEFVKKPVIPKIIYEMKDKVKTLKRDKELLKEKLKKINAEIEKKYLEIDDIGHIEIDYINKILEEYDNL